MIDFKWIDKWQFRCKSKNAHGLHSPFVFDFYNQIKKRMKLRNSEKDIPFLAERKGNRIFNALLDELNPKSILIFGQIKNKELDQLKTKFDQVYLVHTSETKDFPSGSNPFDLILINSIALLEEEHFLDFILSHIYNQSTVIIPSIHASKHALAQWKKLIRAKSIRISMDFYFLGILFFRKESTKQDFLLRF